MATTQTPGSGTASPEDVARFTSIADNWWDQTANSRHYMLLIRCGFHISKTKFAHTLAMTKWRVTFKGAFNLGYRLWWRLVM